MEKIIWNNKIIKADFKKGDRIKVINTLLMCGQYYNYARIFMKYNIMLEVKKIHKCTHCNKKTKPFFTYGCSIIKKDNDKLIKTLEKVKKPDDVLIFDYATLLYYYRCNDIKKV